MSDTARDITSLLIELVDDYDNGLGLLMSDRQGMMAAFYLTDEDGNKVLVEVSNES